MFGEGGEAPPRRRELKGERRRHLGHTSSMPISLANLAQPRAGEANRALFAPLTSCLLRVSLLLRYPEISHVNFSVIPFSFSSR